MLLARPRISVLGIYSFLCSKAYEIFMLKNFQFKTVAQLVLNGQTNCCLIGYFELSLSLILQQLVEMLIIKTSTRIDFLNLVRLIS